MKPPKTHFVPASYSLFFCILKRLPHACLRDGTGGTLTQPEILYICPQGLAYFLTHLWTHMSGEKSGLYTVKLFLVSAQFKRIFSWEELFSVDEILFRWLLHLHFAVDLLLAKLEPNWSLWVSSRITWMKRSMAHFVAAYHPDDLWHNRVSPHQHRESTLLMSFFLQGFDVQRMFVCTQSCLFFFSLSLGSPQATTPPWQNYFPIPHRVPVDLHVPLLRSLLLFLYRKDCCFKDLRWKYTTSLPVSSYTYLFFKTFW